MPGIGTVLVAAGSSQRAGVDIPKQFVAIGGQPMFVVALSRLLLRSAEAVVVAPAGGLDAARDLLRASRLLSDERHRGKRVEIVAGGVRRQDSVRAGLAALSKDIEFVLVHDAARPFVTDDLVERVLEAAGRHGAAAPVISPPDTVKQIEGDRAVATLDREALALAQTPQAFRRDVLERAYADLGDNDVTDDAQAVELSGVPVAVVPGETGNFKVTTRRDLDLAAMLASVSAGLGPAYRVGTGSDTHRLVRGRKLVLCGVDIPHETGLEGHSDADVATHAICDALLGAVAAGDIGVHFPPGDPEFKDISSLVLLERVAAVVKGRGFEIWNLDVTISAEAPRLSPHVPDMRRAIAGAAGIDVDRVSVKATTTEGTGLEGQGLAVSSVAAASVRKLPG